MTTAGTTASPAIVKFESELEQDLRRGLEPPAPAIGVERPVRAWWMPPEHMQGPAWDAVDGGLILGRRAGRLIGCNDDRHILLIAGTRAGKGVSLILPNLLRYKGSALIVDIKGELAYYTAARRGHGSQHVAADKSMNGRVHILDPFDTTKGVDLPKARFNPLAELSPDDPNVVDDAARIAEGMIVPGQNEPHWGESAQSLLRALILLVLNDPDETRRNLLTVRALLRLTDVSIEQQKLVAIDDGDRISSQQALIELMRAQSVPPASANSEIIAGMAEQLAAMGPNELGSILSTARTQTQWLDSPALQDMLSVTKRESTLRLADLKQKDRNDKPCSVYLCLPATRMGTHNRWLRLIIALTLSVMERIDMSLATSETPGEKAGGDAQNDSHKPLPVLFLLDEFPVLGHMQSIEDAAGQMAGFGVKLWTVIQDLGQLRKHYKAGASTFIGNSGVTIAFGNADLVTLKELSGMLGQTQVDEQHPTGVFGHQISSGAMQTKPHRGQAPLLAEHEVRLAFAREKRRAMILTAGYPPAVVERVVYHDPGDEEFAGMYPDRRR